MFSGIITIDGFAASGKSSCARLLSDTLGVPLLSTGMAHRLNVWVLLREGVNPTNEEEIKSYLSELKLDFSPQNSTLMPSINGNVPSPGSLDSNEVRRWLPQITRNPDVCRVLANHFRRATMGMHLVAEGHGLGTGIFPEAGHKFFCDAPSSVRIWRRWRDRCAAGQVSSLEEVARELQARDSSDATREVNPVCRLPDMIVVDTGALNLDECLNFMLKALD